jgi:hypothetical protein
MVPSFDADVDGAARASPSREHPNGGSQKRGDREPQHREAMACGHGFCGSDYVIPVAWRESGGLGWWVCLHCGECAFVRDVEVGDEEAKRADIEPRQRHHDDRGRLRTRGVLCPAAGSTVLTASRSPRRR